MTGKPSICKDQTTEAIHAGENPDPVTGVLLVMGSSGSRLVLRNPRMSVRILTTPLQGSREANYREGIFPDARSSKRTGDRMGYGAISSWKRFGK